jgi:hypothetical protein
MRTMRFLLALTLNVAAAFMAPKPVSVTRSVLAATPADAIASMDVSQAATVNQIASTIPDLEQKPDFTWTAATGVSVGGSGATVDSRDAAGPANVAWLTAMCVDSKLSSLTIFNGPLTDVPHLLSRCAVVGDTLQFTLDFRPRAYGAYEMKRPDGSYPGPDELGRQSFEYSGARTAFDSKFGTDEVKAFMDSTLASFEGAENADQSPTELDLSTRGPLYTTVSMPLTDGNVQAVVAAREKAAKYWLSWAQDSQHQHRPGAPINSQYLYDTKYKQNAYGVLADTYSKIFGAGDGSKLAIGESGPLDEGYVGGGS